MARGPFQGTWRQGIRPTVTHAPDALVFINGEQDILGCPSCRRRLDFNKFITSIQVDLGIDSVPGSASISMSVPRHSVDDFFFDGTPVITPMMEVEIFAKGFFLVEGVPQYYPIFWGMVTEVSDNYSGGEHTVTINCSDILKWWELCKININPAFTQATGGLGRSLFGNVLFGMNPYDIIWTLAQQSFGDVVIGSGSLISLYKEASQKSTFNYALTDMMLYWEQRFSRIRSNLLLYGTKGNVVRGDILYAEYQKDGPGQAYGGKKSQRHPFASRAVRKANGGEPGSQMVFDPTDPDVVAFRTQFSAAGQVNFWTSEFQTKLEIAQSAKEAIGFEFYMDVTGDIVFKPPFYNLDILANKPISWIQDIDIIDWGLSESEGEVVTQIQVQGSFGGNIDYGFGEEATPFTSVTDYHLLRKYGWRTQTYNSEFMGAPILMFYTGMDLLDRYNSRRFRGTVNIPMRPELRLGFPVYLAPKDQIWYVVGISHNIQFGSRATTTLSLSAKRGKFIAPKGIGKLTLTGYSGGGNNPTPTAELAAGGRNLTSKQIAKGGRFSAEIGNAAQMPPSTAPEPGDPSDNPYEPMVIRHPKTGRIVGYPNIVMMYTRPFTPPPDTLSKLQGRKVNAKAAREATAKLNKNVTVQGKEQLKDINSQLHTAQTDDAIRAKYMNNRYQYGLNSAGVYVYMHDASKVIREIVLMPVANISYDDPDAAPGKQHKGATGMIRPVSDERGFEVVGHFKYGRNVALRDGSLVLNENQDQTNLQAQISTSLALSGELFDTLQAQSSGLGTVTTGYPNPAEAVIKLSPEDLQTAATVNPETGKPEFATEGMNFVDTAPLGSPEQQGSTNELIQADVEASQLSRALTLAEMRVREDILDVDSDCACILGRSDLAFINVGYQVKTLNTSGGDTTSLGLPDQTGNATVNDLMLDRLNTQDAVIAQAEEEARVRFEQEQVARGEVGFNLEDFTAEVVEQAQLRAGEEWDKAHAAELEAAGISEQVGLLAEGLADGRPVYNESFNAQNVSARVEEFLTNLYTALDTSHQQYEAALRGEKVNVPQVDVQAIRFGAEADQGEFAPPFSVGGRALGGDPLAIAKAGAQAADDLVKSWSEFGDQLESNIKKTALETQIKQLQKDIAEQSAKCDQLKAAKASGSVLIPSNILGHPATEKTPGIDTAIEECEKSLNEMKQKLLNLQQQLNDVNNADLGDIINALLP